MNIRSTAELRRLEAQEHKQDGQPKWYDRITGFWQHLADVFSPKLATPLRQEKIERIMSIGDD